MNNRLARLQQHFQQAEQDRQNRSTRTGNYYQLYKIPFDAESIIRFIPDANPKNEQGFLLNNHYHELVLNGETKRVPCMKNYGHKRCPICEIAQDFYKREGKTSVNGKQLYRNFQVLARVGVIKDPIPVEDGQESHAGKIRVVNMTKQVVDRITSALTSSSDPLDSMPDELETGYNFIVRKTKNSDGHAQYIDSSFARSASKAPAFVTEDDIIDLSTLLPKEPTEAEVESMLKAHLTGEPYDDGSSAFRRMKSGVGALDRYIGKSSAPVEAPTSTATNVTASVTSTDDDDDDDVDDAVRQLQARAAQRRAAKGG